MIPTGKTKCTSEKGLLSKPIAKFVILSGARPGGNTRTLLLKRRRTCLFVIVSKALKCTLTGHDLQINSSA